MYAEYTDCLVGERRSHRCARRSMGWQAALLLMGVFASLAPSSGLAQTVALSRVEGTVIDSLRSRAPLAGAMVVLVEHNRYATSDAQGRFRFDSVPVGRASLGVLHPVLDSLDLQVPHTSVEVASGGASVTVTIPPALRMYAQLCTEERDADGGVIVGRLRDIDDGTPIAGAAVATEWVEYTVGSGHSTPQQVATAARSDANGVFVLCNVPTKVPLSVRARHQDIVAGPSQVMLDDRLLGRTELGMSRRDTTARHVRVVDSLMPHETMPGTASLRGRIMRTDGAPASFAAVGVLGTGRVTRTDSTGSFTLEGIPAGTRTIDIRAIGSAPQQRSLDFATGSVRDTSFILAPPVQILPTVTTSRGRKPGFEQAGFFERQRLGLGAFMTEGDIRRAGALDLSSALQGMRGVRIEGGVFRGMPRLRGGCMPNFYLDGIRFPVDGAAPNPGVMSPYSDLNAFVPVHLVKAIEVYSGIGAIPFQYQDPRATCGSILIWTY